MDKKNCKFDTSLKDVNVKCAPESWIFIIRNLNPFKHLQYTVVDVQKVHSHPCSQAINQIDQSPNQLDAALPKSMGNRNP